MVQADLHFYLVVIHIIIFFFLKTNSKLPPSAERRVKSDLEREVSPFLLFFLSFSLFFCSVEHFKFHSISIIDKKDLSLTLTCLSFLK